MELDTSSGIQSSKRMLWLKCELISRSILRCIGMHLEITFKWKRVCKTNLNKISSFDKQKQHKYGDNHLILKFWKWVIKCCCFNLYRALCIVLVCTTYLKLRDCIYCRRVFFYLCACVNWCSSISLSSLQFVWQSR